MSEFPAPGRAVNIPHEDAFRAHLLLEKRLSENTVRSYLSDLRLCLGQFGAAEVRGEGLARLTPEETRFFFAALASLGFSSASLSRYLASLRGYAAYLMDAGLLASDPCRGVRVPKQQRYKPRSLSLKEIGDLYASAERRVAVGEKGARRDFALLELLYGLGLRVSEAVKLPIDALRFEEGLVLVQGKGNKQRLVPLGAKVVASLKDYLASERVATAKTRCAFLIVNSRGSPLSRMGAWKIMRKLSLEAGLDAEGISPHTFRHTFATHLIEAGADLRAVQELLGHADIGTTQIYTHLDQDYLRETHRSFHPRNHA